jgi:hypothetical protein
VGILRVMSRRGDDQIKWDDQQLRAGDPEAMAAIQEAERIFAAERAKGATAFRLEPDKPAQRIDQFDATATQIILVPRVVGGRNCSSLDQVASAMLPATTASPLSAYLQ